MQQRLQPQDSNTMHELGIGKINENVLKRSVLKRIKHKRKEVIVNAAAGEDAAAIALYSDGCVVTSTQTIAIDSKIASILVVNKAVNNVVVTGAEAMSISVSIVVPDGTSELYIKDVITTIDNICRDLNVALTGGHTEASRNVSCPIITVTAIGRVNKKAIITTKGAKPGDDIVITKWIALSGTNIVASAKKEELLKRFSPGFVQRAIDCEEVMSVAKEAHIAATNGATAMHDLSSGGVYAALWELGSASGVGLSVNLLDIPVMQETIEICEEYNLNPYEMMSDGALLITTPNGSDMVKLLNEADISAQIIGKITENNDRVVINGDEKRFINLPKSEEIYKI